LIDATLIDAMVIDATLIAWFRAVCLGNDRVRKEETKKQTF